ncbi:MAG: hypothetical protein HC903_11110 [Methylacidiphilales bacterium]|nr:hypothetical protein [Candidatus Methylacidiphilales bacterium]NJR17130.1 hypothetical protein [Calothrix sp. CSU_2_0]
MADTLCVDIGNFSTLSAVVSGRENTEVFKMRSLIFDATQSGECRDAVHPADSPLITVGGKTYKLGRHAKGYTGFLSAVEAGKSRADIILPILLANTPDGFEGVVKMLVPSRNELQEKLIAVGILGTHSFTTKAEGKEISAIANFTNIEFVRETDSAAKFAYESGVVSPDDVVLCIDIGGGTTNVVVATYEDDVFNVIFRKSYDNSGGIQLAQAIANTDVIKSLNREFEITKIMDAITEGKTHIGNRTDYSFAAVWESSVNVWFDGLLSRIMSACDKQLDEVTQILWCGGGSEIIRDRVQNQPGNLFLDNPQETNIRGLIHSAKPQLRIAA